MHGINKNGENMTQSYQSQPQWAPTENGQPANAPQQPAKPKKKRRVFLWFFLVVQVIFIIWIATAAASHPSGPSTAVQAAQQCANGGWQGVFKSQADCQVHFAHGLNEAGTAGKGIAIGLIVIVWVVVDFFLGVTYGIYRLASRR